MSRIYRSPKYSINFAKNYHINSQITDYIDHQTSVQLMKNNRDK